MIAFLGDALRVPRSGTGRDMDDAAGQVESSRSGAGRLRELLESAQDALVVIDAHGRIVQVNRQTEVLFGYPEDALVGEPVEMLLPGQFRGGSFLVPVLATGEGRDLLARRADGSQFPVEASLAPLEAEAEAEAGALVSVGLRDVTARRESDQRLQRLAAIVESADDAIFVKSLDGTILEWNEGAEHIYGYTADEIVGRSVSVLAPPDRPDEVPGILSAIGRGERAEHFETVRMRKDGALVDVLVKISPVRNSAGEIVGASTFARDIGVELVARADLVAAHEELSAHAAELDRRNRHLVLVNEMSELLGSMESEAEAYEIAGGYGADLFPGVSGAIVLINASGTLLEASVSWGEPIAGELIFAPGDCWAMRRGRICGHPGAHNAPRCRHIHDDVASYMCVPLIAQGRSIGVLHLARSTPVGGPADLGFDSSSEAVASTFMENLALALSNFRLREMLQVQSIRDPLTGLFNRRYMDEALERELKRSIRNERPLGLMMIDVDHFKNWNDAHGHEAGDTLIRELARLLEYQTRGEDIAARYGGDEFLVVLPETSLETTTARAHELQRAMRGISVRHHGRTLGNVTVTIGVAAYPDDANEIHALVRAADTAMYTAKRAGRDQVGTSSPLDLTKPPPGPDHTIPEAVANATG